MKRIFFLFLCLMTLCFALAEDVDWTTMSDDEWVEYTLTLSMRDALVLLDKMDEDPGEVFRDAYEQGIQEWESLSDMALYISYASMHTVMQERDLMKYLPILGLDHETSTGSDLPGMSFEDLASLRDQIMLEMMSRNEWQEVKVPVGTYKVGETIPAGHWIVTCAPQNYCYIDVGSSLEDNGKDIVYGSKGYYHIALAGVDSGISDRGYPSSVDLNLQDGMYISIERAYVTFTPYTGQHDFGFSFK